MYSWFLLVNHMSGSLLRTKLHIPNFYSEPVSRRRLLNQLDQTALRKLTIVSAPAGFGKTTLVVDWLNTFNSPTGWLSLSIEDNDINRFLMYWLAALQCIDRNIGSETESFTSSLQPPQIYQLLVSWINDSVSVSDDFVVVLDDYHLITSQAVHDVLQFWIEHMPSNMHLLIMSRNALEFKLSRLRAQNQIVELSANDLRFTHDETNRFLNEAMQLKLSEDHIDALDKRTEGWITGLQLAGLSVQGHANRGAFIESFTGSHRFVLDYLVEEVLQQQSESVQMFLLQTAILTRLSAALCDAILVDVNLPAQETLEFLERANLMIFPLDNDGQWYRYHHLFSETLNTLLKKNSPNLVNELHLRASQWFEKNQYYSDAIHHAFASEDFEWAAYVIHRAWVVIRQYYHESTLRDWVDQLPETIVMENPILGIHYAIALLPIEPIVADRHIENVEKWLNANPTMISKEHTDDMNSLPGLVAFSRACQSAMQRHVSNTVSFANRSLELLSDDEYLYRSSAAVLLGLAHWINGDLKAAYQAIYDSMTDMQKAQHVSGIIGIRYLLADLQLAIGNLRQADSMLQFALNLSKNQSEQVPQGTADVYVLMSELYRERNELELANESLSKARSLGEHAVFQEQQHRWYIAMAHLEEAYGRYEQALAFLDEAEQVQMVSPTPDSRPIHAFKARLWIKQGGLIEAIAWKNDQNLSIDIKIEYLNEFTCFTLVRLQIMRYRVENSDDIFVQTNRLLDQLFKNAQSFERIRSMIESLILKALLHYAQDKQSAIAFVSLKDALELAKPEGYIRIFIDEGEPMKELLHQATTKKINSQYINQLLASYEKPKLSQQSNSTDFNQLFEPLSERELEILEFISQGFTNQQIADRLYLSLYTIKAHARNIYGKLDVGNRTQAVNRARKLGMLPS